MRTSMRRKNQALSQEECVAVLQRGTAGVLAVTGEEDYPYAVPLSYVYYNCKLYFHCAARGYKMEALARNPKVSFCVIDQDQVVPEKYTTYFRSVIVFGQAHILTDKEEKKAALRQLAMRFNPAHPESAEEEIKEQLDVVCVVEIDVEAMSGKEAKELRGNR